MIFTERPVINALRAGHQTAVAICEATGYSMTPVRRILDKLEFDKRVRITRKHVGCTKAKHYTLIE